MQSQGCSTGGDVDFLRPSGSLVSFREFPALERRGPGHVGQDGPPAWRAVGAIVARW